ncbi:MAG: DUF4388 domain-containing protein [Polyangiaceae bacterium]
MRAAAEALIPEDWPRPEGALRFSGQITAESSLLDIVAMLAHASQTGTLIVTSGDAVRAIAVDCGMLVGAATTRAAERIGEFLCQTGDLSHDELESALYIAAIDGRRIGDHLVATRRIDLATLEASLQQQAEEIFFAALRVEEGAFAVFTDVLVPAMPQARGLLSLVMEAQRRADAAAELRRTVGSSAHVPIPNVDIDGSELREVSAELADVFERCDAARSVADIAKSLGWSELATMRAVHQLVELSIVAIASPRVSTTADILRVANTLIMEVHRRCDRLGIGDELRRDVDAHVERTSDAAAMLRVIAPAADGHLDSARVHALARTSPRDELLEHAIRTYARVVAERARVLMAAKAAAEVTETWRPKAVG